MARPDRGRFPTPGGGGPPGYNPNHAAFQQRGPRPTGMPYQQQGASSYQLAVPSPRMAAPTTLVLNDAMLSTFRVCRTFQENSGDVNHADFSTQGEFLLTSASDDSIVIYDCLKGSSNRVINCKKYGVENIIYTHSSNAALHSSSRTDDSIRYLNLQENKYLATFQGHTKKIRHICLSPVDDQFISASADKTIRLWDHRVGCTGTLPNLDAAPSMAFDPEGLVFAVSCCVEREQRIMLYDLRNFTDGPFAVFRYGEQQDGDWCGMKISPNGRYLLVTTNGPTVYVMDSFTGECLFTFRGHANKGKELEASFTPDSNYALIGSTNGQVHIWNLKNGAPLLPLPPGRAKDPAHLVKFSPTNALMMTAGKQ
ncbi:WD repeat-containing protein 82 [Hypsibius exemplaris]|uniref:WD repeat-containing protein 82 n=1 Tax=Hypsibius exemplaris TaxID=2072580 RepID=A0A1W0X1U5_HYPEX|nr:WD repeat-containing protein 82 [Hypsibius exemplaris]